MPTFSFPIIACKVLMELRAKRQKASNEESNMVDYRKTLDEWFSQNGDPGDASPENADVSAMRLHAERLALFRNRCTEHTRTLRAIDASRHVIRWLAGKYDRVIDLASEGWLKEDQLQDELNKLLSDQPALPLFSIPPDEVPDPAKARIGEPKQAGQSTEKPPLVPPTRPTEPDAEQIKLEANTTALETLDLDGKSARALRNSGLMTLGSIARYRRERYGNCRLTNLGIAGKDELKIEKALMLAANGLVPTANVLHRKKKGKSAAV